ncbi:uncharacterized protein MELLADRAFT_117489 [Melampsora larici-populina 98AG31]|uniref:Uncharacterized protein n=1 Tax=Melampsora larici-populina (strain 98AG31 / pathotype 3-4-7) TaxID=747676 RepID=F4RXV9_MELLP|nr:uncharacterized protein MELLADRAFT_117489 [Melampsora larici-populina 98AG31]EGG02830.1 hypothetical protein MELLADRAFT_117489 [Melampsora larici-populina 98AG31]
MNDMNYKPSKCLLDDYQLTHKSINTLTSSSWSGLGLDSRLIQNIELEAQLLDHRIISTILKIHHLELYIPCHPNSSTSYLIGIINLTIINSYEPTKLSRNPNQLNPSTLLVCLSSVKLNQLGKSIKSLIDGIQEICLYELNDQSSLSNTLNDLENLSSSTLSPNFLISNLNKLLILIEKRIC